MSPLRKAFWGTALPILLVFLSAGILGQRNWFSSYLGSGPSGQTTLAQNSSLGAYPLPGATRQPTPARRGPLEPYPLPGSSQPPQSFTPVYTEYLPLIFRAVGAKGTAGIILANSNLGFTNEITMGVQWGYDWNYVLTTTSPTYSPSWPYQIVNDIRSKISGTWDIIVDNGCPLPPGNHFDANVQSALQRCVADVARSRQGLYWMIWNEPDLCPNNTNSDCIAPVTATLYFKTISDTILSADPTARMIVGNVGVEYPQYPITGCGSPQIGKIGCGVYWLTQFISAYTTTYGIDPRPAIAGYGIHAYSIGDKTGLGLSPCGDEYSNTSNTNACLLSHFTATVQAGTNWVAANDPGKELWLTEVNWEAADHPFDTWSLQTTRMQQICSELSSDVAAGAVQRYSWFYGSYASLSEPLLITVSLYAVDQSGALSPAGQQFISCGPR